ncbi:MAG: flagellar biosynthetic protein FliO [Alphaproteobacteria bacterium]|nr:flagellar biosynthetic protein FliO [Alphaproteobacteria bacterium]
MTALASLITAWRDRSSSLALRLPVRHAQVVQALPLGPGARLLVVEFAGRRLLIGQSRAGLAALAESPPE